MTAAVPRSRPRRLTGRHVLLLTLGFFGLVLAMNAAMVLLALDTFSGTVSDHAYQEGLAYNRRLAEAAEQERRGWQGELALTADGLDLTLRTHDGRPVTGLVLQALLSRPATTAHDRRLPLVEAAPGDYSLRTDLAPGIWLVVVEGGAADGSSFRTEARLWR